MSPTRPLAIDLCCGIGGWAEGFLAVGYRVVGFDILRYPQGYPGDLVLQDICTLDGQDFRGARIIVASPPCQEFSRLAQPWWRETRWTTPDMTLWLACERIIRESECLGIIENVRMAQHWAGPATYHFGSFYLWGDVPFLRPRMHLVKGAYSGRTVRMNSKGSYYRVKRSVATGWQRAPHLRAKIPFDLAYWLVLETLRMAGTQRSVWSV